MDRLRIPVVASIEQPPDNEPLQRGAATDLVVPGWGDTAAWRAYLKLWEQFSQRPETATVQRFLNVNVHGGDATQDPAWRAAGPIPDAVIRSLRLGDARVQRYETSRIIVDTTADERDAREVAADLERVFWVWTQLFFPFWNQSDVVGEQLSIGQDGGLRLRHDASLPNRPPMRVVLFADRQQYRDAMSASVPGDLAAGVVQSSGFYDDRRRISFFYVGEGAEVVRARRHEWTHQLLDRSTSRRRTDVKRSDDFWVVEGIASYMESLAFPKELHPDADEASQSFAVLGGWDTSRLMHRRIRGLNHLDSLTLSSLNGSSRTLLADRRDLADWYGDATAWTHAAMHASVGSRSWLLNKLAKVYGFRTSQTRSQTVAPTATELKTLLRIDDSVLQRLPSPRRLTEFSIRDTEVTHAGFAAQFVQRDLQLVDVTGRPIGSSDLDRLVGRSPMLRQLWVERSAVDNQLALTLSRCKHLRELDASVCRVGDDVVAALDDQPLETIYLTGSLVTDACVEDLIELATLKVLDVQRTGVGVDATEKIANQRPDIELNPLRIVSP